MLKYYNPKRDKNGYVYSCDMLRVSFDMRRDQVQNYNAYLENCLRTDICSYPQNFAQFKYRHLYTIDYGSEYSTMTVGLCFNGTTREENYKCFLEVNPNKCFDNEQCVQDIEVLLLHASVSNVTRFDLAIDIPYDRNLVYLRKDQRKYAFEMKSLEDKTEYLGVRNNPGRVKLYNKTLESKLDNDLTRLEMTCGSLFLSDVLSTIPYVWIQASQQKLMLDDDLTQNDMVLVEAIQASPTPELYLKKLTYRKRVKIEPYVISGGTELEVDKNCICDILTDLKRFNK